MKKAFMLSVLVSLLVIASIAMVSATEYKTLIAGKIYDSPNFETAGPVAGATVHVICNSVPKTAESKNDGTYSVSFDPEDGCLDTTASAYAEKEGVVSDTETAQIQDYTGEFNLYLGVINLALIPEFGLFVGGLTILAAVGIFFFVRKK